MVSAFPMSGRPGPALGKMGGIVSPATCGVQASRKTIAVDIWTGNMRGNRPSVEHLKAVTRFEEIRKTLLKDGDQVYLEKPLAHWVLPADRRLPLAFLGRTLGDLLETGLEELAATPGVGEKKIRSFLDLLGRVANAAPCIGNGNGNGTNRESSALVEPSGDNGFEPHDVSQLVWSQWQETVKQCGLGQEPLGQVAPSLRNVTRVIWQTPLEEYLDVSLADLRKRRTYGEKRVRAVLEIFFGLHQLLGGAGPQRELTVRLMPRHIDNVDRWIGHCLQCAALPDEREIAVSYILPLVEQLRHDASQQIVQLVETRLGIDSSLTSIRKTARQMGLTRARVYQLLNEINDIFKVRWTLGRCQSYHLLERLELERHNDTSLDQFRAAVELFYPGARRGADGIVENASLVAD